MAHERNKLIPGLGTLVKIHPMRLVFRYNNLAYSTAATLPEFVEDFNELLAKLQAAGIFKMQYYNTMSGA